MVARGRHGEETPAQGNNEDVQGRRLFRDEAAQGGGGGRQGDGRHCHVFDHRCQPGQPMPGRKGHQPRQGLVK